MEVRTRFDVPVASVVILRAPADDVEASFPFGADVDGLDDPDKDRADPAPGSRVPLDTGETPRCGCWGIFTCCCCCCWW